MTPDTTENTSGNIAVGSTAPAGSTVLITFRAPRSLIARVNKAAAAEYLNRTAFILRALTAALKPAKGKSGWAP